MSDVSQLDVSLPYLSLLKRLNSNFRPPLRIGFKIFCLFQVIIRQGDTVEFPLCNPILHVHVTMYKITN